MSGKWAKFFAIATGFVYTLIAPVVLMLAIYYVITKYIMHRGSPVMLLIFVVLGVLTGYWSLFKEIKEKSKSKKANKDNEENRK